MKNFDINEGIPLTQKDLAKLVIQKTMKNKSKYKGDLPILSQSDFTKSLNRFNKKIRKLSKDDAFIDSVSIALAYQAKTNGKLIKDISKKDIDIMANDLLLRYQIKDKSEITRLDEKRIEIFLKRISKKIDSKDVRKNITFDEFVYKFKL